MTVRKLPLFDGFIETPLLDPQKSGRVLMDPLMKLVTTALKWSYAHAEADVTSQHLKAAAELLTLRRDKIQIIDAENNRLKEDEQEKQESGEKQKKPKSNGAARYFEQINALYFRCAHSHPRLICASVFRIPTVVNPSMRNAIYRFGKQYT